MNRREFLRYSAAIPGVPLAAPALFPQELFAAEAPPVFRRVRPGDAGWPTEQQWAALGKAVGGRLLELESPWERLRKAPAAAADQFFREMKNQFAIGDDPALTQTFAWIDGWTSQPSVYAVAARNAQDVVEAVKFARERRLRLVVKGGGHSYKGTSCSADSLLVWTRAMNDIVLHDAFIPQGCEGRQASQPAVTVGAGAIWAQLYHAVTTQAGRYVQGGGCTTVGVAGLIQSGGFGSFSKRYGLAAAGLLEASVVTADGVLRVANPARNPDLFWALKGGGGGSFGVVTSLTLRTRELPAWFGGVFGTIKASSDAAFRELAGSLMRFYADKLLNPHWGEQIRFRPDRSVVFSLVFQGLDQPEAERVWEPFFEKIRRSPEKFSIEKPLRVIGIPARSMWDPLFFKKIAPEAIVHDDRPGAPERNFVWEGDAGQAGQILHAYRSAWLSEELLRPARLAELVDALVTASRHWSVSLHFNKGLAGAPPEERAAARETATHPEAADAFALAIIAATGPAAYPGIAGREPDLQAGRERARRVNQAMEQLLKPGQRASSYVSESDFFEANWQESFWGSNYPRLLEIKQKYDPEGLFFVHQGVGTEHWSADGFNRFA